MIKTFHEGLLPDDQSEFYDELTYIQLEKVDGFDDQQTIDFVGVGDYYSFLTVDHLLFTFDTTGVLVAEFDLNAALGDHFDFELEQLKIEAFKNKYQLLAYASSPDHDSGASFYAIIDLAEASITVHMLPFPVVDLIYNLEHAEFIAYRIFFDPSIERTKDELVIFSEQWEQQQKFTFDRAAHVNPALIQSNKLAYFDGRVYYNPPASSSIYQLTDIGFKEIFNGRNANYGKVEDPLKSAFVDFSTTGVLSYGSALGKQGFYSMLINDSSVYYIKNSSAFTGVEHAYEFVFQRPYGMNDAGAFFSTINLKKLKESYESSGANPSPSVLAKVNSLYDSNQNDHALMVYKVNYDLLDEVSESNFKSFVPQDSRIENSQKLAYEITIHPNPIPSGNAAFNFQIKTNLPSSKPTSITVSWYSMLSGLYESKSFSIDSQNPVNGSFDLPVGIYQENISLIIVSDENGKGGSEMIVFE